MTRVDFYQLSAQGRSELEVIFRLLHKAFEQQLNTLVLGRDEQHCLQLNEQLWSFDEQSFLPHGLNQELGHQPILIQTVAENSEQRQLLLNLNPEIPACFSQFERVIELITENNLQNARQHYRFYKDRGYPLELHQL